MLRKVLQMLLKAGNTCDACANMAYAGGRFCGQPLTAAGRPAA